MLMTTQEYEQKADETMDFLASLDSDQRADFIRRMSGAGELERLSSDHAAIIVQRCIRAFVAYDEIAHNGNVRMTSEASKLPDALLPLSRLWKSLMHLSEVIDGTVPTHPARTKYNP